MGATPLSANGTVFKIYQTSEGDGKPQKSLVIVACDNRSGTLDRCELTYTQRGANGSAYDSTETVSITGPFLLRAQWLPGDVHCAGVAVDRQGAVAARYGTWTEPARLCG